MFSVSSTGDICSAVARELAANRSAAQAEELHTHGKQTMALQHGTPNAKCFNSIQFNLFHPRIIIHDMGHVKD
jgi:hypothetical protein